MVHQIGTTQAWSHWSSFAEQPGAVLDAIRRGPVSVLLNLKPRFTVKRADKTPPGAETISAEEISRKRRDMRFDLLAGEVYAITRYGRVEAVIEGVKS